MIPKNELVDGAYYKGTCRNADIARWSAEHQKFFHWRFKFGHTFIEEIRHPEDEQRYDVFVPEELIEEHIEIPPTSQQRRLEDCLCNL